MSKGRWRQRRRRTLWSSSMGERWKGRNGSMQNIREEMRRVREEMTMSTASSPEARLSSSANSTPLTLKSSSSSSSSSPTPPVSLSVIESRLPSSPVSLLFFIIYFPVGCGLALVRFLLSFQIFLFATLWPLPYGRVRNYCLRTMCSYLLGVWVKEIRRPPPPPPPSVRRRHYLNRTRVGGDGNNVGGMAENNGIDNDEDHAYSSSTSPQTFSSSPSPCSTSPRLFTANCLTPLDGAMLSLLRTDIRVLNTFKLNPILSWVLGYGSLRPSRPGGGGGAAAATPRMTTFEIVAEEEVNCGTKGIVTFPELTPTNGKAVLKFEEKLVQWRRGKTDGAVSQMMPVHPVAVKFRRFPIDFPFSTLESSTWTDFFWLLWCPINVFTVEMLEEIAAAPTETPRDLAAKAQTAIAVALKVPPLTHSHLDREEYAKRRLKDLRHEESLAASPHLRRRPRQSPTAAGRTNNTQMASRDAATEIMVEQVKTVLPQVPTSVIRQDVKLTKDVDVSITRFLEGVVAYVPEKPPVSTKPSSGSPASSEVSSSSSSASLSESINASKSKSSPTSTQKQPTPPLIAASFAKSAALRQMSFAERKKLLIEQSKERYLKRIEAKKDSEEAESGDEADI